jgi:hypothetical protein
MRDALNSDGMEVSSKKSNEFESGTWKEDAPQRKSELGKVL